FLYRPSPEWPEACGRDVAEAMACRVPPVVASNARIAQHIRPGENGLIPVETDDAMDSLLRLLGGPALRARVGVAPRRTIADRYGEARLAESAAHYVRAPARMPA